MSTPANNNSRNNRRSTVNDGTVRTTNNGGTSYNVHSHISFFSGTSNPSNNTNQTTNNRTSTATASTRNSDASFVCTGARAHEATNSNRRDSGPGSI